MSGFKKINIEIKRSVPLEFDKETNRATKFKTSIEEVGFNLFNISYWRGETSYEEDQNGNLLKTNKNTFLYFQGNPKALCLNMSKEDFEKQLEKEVGDDKEAINHLATKIVEKIDDAQKEDLQED